MDWVLSMDKVVGEMQERVAGTHSPTQSQYSGLSNHFASNHQPLSSTYSSSPSIYLLHKTNYPVYHVCSPFYLALPLLLCTTEVTFDEK